MRSWVLILGVVCSLLAFSACADDDAEDDCSGTGTCEDNFQDILNFLNQEFEGEGNGDRRKRSAPGYGNSGYARDADYGSYGHGYPSSGYEEYGKSGYGDSGYGASNLGYGSYGSYGGYGNRGQYGYDSKVYREFGAGYGGNGYGSQGNNGYGNLRASYYRVPKPTYHKSYREGKWQLDNKHLIKNYYKKGTYEVAKKYFIAMPFVKITPVTTTTSVDYIGQLRTYNGYKVRLCKTCYKGHPQIEFQSTNAPSRNVIRRFNFLPNTKRVRTQYGTPKIVQTGEAKISEAKGGHYDQGYAGHH